MCRNLLCKFSTRTNFATWKEGILAKMNLFEILPENLFSILSSPNKNIYINALFVIREQFRQEMSMPKEDVAVDIISKMEDEILQMKGDEDEEETIENSLSGKAHYILRRLKWAGWIETEMQGSNFEEDIIIPDYAIEIIDLLYSFTKQKNVEYNSYAYTTYASLKIAIDEDIKQLYRAVMAAYENTTKLVNSIKSLHHNLGRYYRKITELEKINQILEEHFDKYKTYMDKIYHPLKTDDPVDMYKVPICKMIDRIVGQDEILSELIEQAVKSGNYDSEEEAKNDLLGKLFEIQDVYTNINKQISVVDRKNTEYVRATNRRIGYLLTSDKELKGKLINILKNAKREEVTDLMEQNANLFKQNYLDKDSIFLRSSKSDKKQGEPLAVEKVEIDSKEDFEEFFEKINNSYTSEKVNQYMENLLGQKPIITTNDININSDEEFILLILGTMRTEKSFYNIEYNKDFVKKGRYRVPDMTISRKI